MCRKHLPFTPETKLKIKSIRKCAQKAKTKKDIPYVVVLHTQEKIKTILRRLNFVRFDFEHVLCILHEHDSAQFGHFDHIRIDSMHESI